MLGKISRFDSPSFPHTLVYTVKKIIMNVGAEKRGWRMDEAYIGVLGRRESEVGV